MSSADLLLIPEVELMAVEFFRAQPEVAALLGDRVYSALPARPEWPAARVVRWGGWPVIATPLALDEAWCSVEVWGGPKAQAHHIAAVMRATTERLLALPYVSARRFGGFLDSPDTSYDPAKPRWRFDFSLLLRPVVDYSPAGHDPGPRAHEETPA